MKIRIRVCKYHKNVDEKSASVSEMKKRERRVRADDRLHTVSGLPAPPLATDFHTVPDVQPPCKRHLRQR